MQKSRPPELPARLAALRARMQRWRQSPGKGLRMPEALWKAAARLAGVHGLSPVAKALGLDYYSLKKRTDSVSGATTPAAPVPPVFLELGVQGAAGSAGCTLELEGPGGVKLKVQLTDTGKLDLVGLAKVLWRRKR